MSTLAVVEEVLRETRTPLVVREIVEIAGARLPTRSRTPDTVVARDLAMDIKRRGEQSLFARVAPGRYTLREYANLARGTGEIEVVEAPAPATIAPLPVPPPATPVIEPVQG